MYILGKERNAHDYLNILEVDSFVDSKQKTTNENIFWP